MQQAMSSSQIFSVEHGCVSVDFQLHKTSQSYALARSGRLDVPFSWVLFGVFFVWKEEFITWSSARMSPVRQREIALHGSGGQICKSDPILRPLARK